MKYTVRFTTFLYPYEIQRETVTADSAEQAKEIIAISGGRVVGVEEIDPRTPQEIALDELAREQAQTYADILAR